MVLLGEALAEVFELMAVEARAAALQSEGAREERQTADAQAPVLRLIHTSDVPRPCRGGNAVRLWVVKE